MIVKTDVLTREADREKYSVVAPVIYNYDSVEFCFRVSEQKHVPVILRCDAKRYDLRMVADLAALFDQQYPQARVALEASNIDSFELAVQAVMAGYSGIAVASSLPVDSEEAMPVIKSITRVARALNVSVQADLSTLEGLTGEKAYTLVKAAHLDMLKLPVSSVTQENLASLKKLIHELRKTSLSTLALDYEVSGDKKILQSLSDSGISKYDMEKAYSDACMAGMRQMCADEKAVKGKLFMLTMSNQMDDIFMATVADSARKVGRFLH